MKLYKKVVIFFAVISISFLVVYYLSCTTNGLRMILSLVLSRTVECKKVSFSPERRGFFDPLIIKNIELSGITGMPSNYILKAESILVEKFPCFIRDVSVKIDKAQMIAPSGEIIFIEGRYKNGNVEFRAKAEHLNVNTLNTLLPERFQGIAVSGDLADITLDLKGVLNDFEVKGNFFIKDTYSRGITVRESRCRIQGRVLNLSTHSDINGELAFNNTIMLAEKLPDSIIKIGEITIVFPGNGIEDISVSVSEGKIVVSDSGHILFSGMLTGSDINAKIYSNYVSVSKVIELSGSAETVKNLKGFLSNLDILISGKIREPKISGSVTVDSLKRSGFVMSKSSIIFDLLFRGLPNKLGMTGEVRIKNGEIKQTKSALIKIQPSRFKFRGDIKNPELHCQGKAEVNKVKINISVEGTVNHPELRLTSFPVLAEGKLLVMIATGQSWKMAEKSISAGKISPDLAGDFVDYFIFGSGQNSLARKMGVDEVLFQTDGKKNELDITKDITNKATLRYGVIQPAGKKEAGAAVQKIGGDYKFTDTVAVEGQRTLKSGREDEPTASKAEDKVLLKVKKNF
ncbi:MAG: translocation/assembly module TamB domain-containing protein [Candidatus Omnitrophota bacterium]